MPCTLGRPLGLHGLGMLPFQTQQDRTHGPVPRTRDASEPNNSTRTRATRSTSESRIRAAAKSAAARMGPMVCELEGPGPTENK